MSKLEEREYFAPFKKNQVVKEGGLYNPNRIDSIEFSKKRMNMWGKDLFPISKRIRVDTPPSTAIKKSLIVRHEDKLIVVVLFSTVIDYSTVIDTSQGSSRNDSIVFISFDTGKVLKEFRMFEREFREPQLIYNKKHHCLVTSSVKSGSGYFSTNNSGTIGVIDIEKKTIEWFLDIEISVVQRGEPNLINFQEDKIAYISKDQREIVIFNLETKKVDQVINLGGRQDGNHYHAGRRSRIRPKIRCLMEYRNPLEDETNYFILGGPNNIRVVDSKFKDGKIICGWKSIEYVYSLALMKRRKDNQEEEEEYLISGSMYGWIEIWKDFFFRKEKDNFIVQRLSKFHVTNDLRIFYLGVYNDFLFIWPQSSLFQIADIKKKIYDDRVEEDDDEYDDFDNIKKSLCARLCFNNNYFVHCKEFEVIIRENRVCLDFVRREESQRDLSERIVFLIEEVVADGKNINSGIFSKNELFSVILLQGQLKFVFFKTLFF